MGVVNRECLSTTPFVTQGVPPQILAQILVHPDTQVMSAAVFVQRYSCVVARKPLLKKSFAACVTNRLGHRFLE